jgi:hypothetical protein
VPQKGYHRQCGRPRPTQREDACPEEERAGELLLEGVDVGETALQEQAGVVGDSPQIRITRGKP